jgi:hypothetical protein
VRIANARFREKHRDGWKSDRGRIFLTYGEPNDIERNASSSDMNSYEIWQYYAIQDGVVFVFGDVRGLGNYRLLHSTARGELYDSSWMRLISKAN